MFFLFKINYAKLFPIAIITTPIIMAAKPMYNEDLTFEPAVIHSLVIIPPTTATTTDIVLKMAYPIVPPALPKTNAE